VFSVVKNAVAVRRYRRGRKFPCLPRFPWLKTPLPFVVIAVVVNFRAFRVFRG
jgi:hypothetical protein